MNEPFIFRVSDCYYIQASYPSPAEHRHFAAHLVFAMERPFTALVNGVSVEAAGIAIGSDVPHTILSEAPTLVVFIDELTPMSRCVKHTLLRGAPWRTLDTSGRPPVSQPPDPSVPAGYGNLSPSLSGKPEAGTGLLSAGDGTLPHPGLHGCGLCHSLPHGGHQPEVVRYVHDRGEADFPGRPGPDQNSR